MSKEDLESTMKTVEQLKKAEHNWLEPAVYYGPADPLGFVVKCQKCGHVKTLQEEKDGCSVPGPINVNDWNVAKKENGYGKSGPIYPKARVLL